ncbi:MAG: glycosyltransferase [Chloroflexota bacterium]
MHLLGFGALPAGARWERPVAERIADLTRRPRRVAFLYENPDTSTFRYRCHNPIGALNRETDDIAAAWFREAEIPALVARGTRLDALVICRVRYTARLADLAGRVRRAGGRVVFDIDDLVFVPDLVPLVVHTLAETADSDAQWDHWFAHAGRLAASHALADRATTTTAALATELAAAHPVPVAILPNRLAIEEEAISRRLLATKAASGARRDGRIHLGYFSGTPSHERDFAIAAPALAAALDADPRLVLRVAGFLRDLGPLAPHAARIERLALMEPGTLQVRTAEVEIALAPLQQNRFTACKSALKWFEPAAVGTVVVASPGSTVAAEIEDGVTGFVAHADDWADALRRAIATLDGDGAAYRAIAGAAADAAYARYGATGTADALRSAYLGS